MIAIELALWQLANFETREMEEDTDRIHIHNRYANAMSPQPVTYVSNDSSPSGDQCIVTTMRVRERLQ